MTYLADCLKKRGLLGPESRVVDVGCGPGRFVAELAKTAGHSAGIDLSPRMLEHGAAYARSLGLANVSYHVCDFRKADIKAMGWEKQFDLVITNITEAVQNIEDLEKLMAMSRGYCLNSSFVHWRDELEEEIGAQVFGLEPRPHPLADGRLFYALFNLLWLKGYYPETFFHKQITEDRVGPDEDMCRYYAQLFAEDKVDVASHTQRIKDYICRQAAADGMVPLRSERYFGYVLWDVRDKACRAEG